MNDSAQSGARSVYDKISFYPGIINGVVTLPVLLAKLILDRRVLYSFGLYVMIFYFVSLILSVVSTVSGFAAVFARGEFRGLSVSLLSALFALAVFSLVLPEVFSSLPFTPVP